MISVLLLQASTTPPPTPYAVYATLAVGVLSLIASGLNIYFSSRTAQKVVTLSTKTTREVAELSAQVSRESAGLAAQTAREIKEQDYKHDFYKRLIGKRLNAWEDSEKIIGDLMQTMIDERDGKKFYWYCSSKDKIEDITNRMRSMLVGQALWMGSEYGKKFTSVYNLCVDIMIESMVSTNGEVIGVNRERLLEAGKKHYLECSILINELIYMHGIIINEFQDIETFLKNISSGRLQAVG